MSFFIAKLENHEEVFQYLHKVSENESQAFLCNKARTNFTQDGGVYWSNIIKISIPPIYYFGFIFLAIYFLFGGWAWLIPSVLFLSFYLVFWRGFHIWAFKKGLRKAGYKGTITLVSNERGLEEVFF